MRLAPDVTARIDHMVTACRLDSASIFFFDRGGMTPRLSYLHHYGLSAEAQHAYKDSMVFANDPFMGTVDASERRGRLVRWEEKTLVNAADRAPDYRSFINHHSVDVVGAYVRPLVPGLLLVFGAHCRPGAHCKSDVAYGLLEHEIADISDGVATRFVDELLGTAEARRALDTIWDASDQPEATPSQRRLSPREREIAELVGRGFQNKQIAFAIGLSEFTVENHLRRVYRKLGVHNRAGMTAQLFRPTSLQ